MGRGESEGMKAVQSHADRQKFAPGRSSESVEVEGVTLVLVSTSVFSYDGNDSRLLQVSSDGSGSSVTYGAARFVNSVASWGSAEDSAVSFSLLCASTDGRVLAAGSASTGVPAFGVPSAGAHAGAGSGAGLLDPYGWASLGVVAPAVPSAQGASSGAAPVLPDSLVGVSAASGVVLGSSGFEVLGARVVDSRVARFTAPDSLAAPVGAGWGADRFPLVGGNPVSLVDPWGLSPVSVEDFNKYREQKASSGITGWVKRTAVGIANKASEIWQGAKDLWSKVKAEAKAAWNDPKKWIWDNKAYIGGVALMTLGGFVGTLSIAGGPVTMILVGDLAGALSSAGMSMITQKQKGSVDMGEVLKDAAIGAVVGGITGGIGGRILAGARDVAGVTPKVSRLASKVAEKTDWKWANSLIRKAVDYKPWASLKGTSGVADDVAMMAPVREAKEFLSHRVGQFLKPGQHKAVFSSGWWHNQAVSQLTTSQPIKYAVKYGVKHAVNNFVPTLSAGVTSLRHQVEEGSHNQQNGNG